jgi:CheY-like chemotaxis protein
VDVDPNQLELALLNLAVNARDAMPDGGRLGIRADEAASNENTRLPPGRYVRICVEDNGIGMDEQTLLRAVEPFFTTKAIGQGTGLGLSMVHGLAAQSGGDLLLESRPGKGTTAKLWLRVADVKPAERDPATAPARSGAATNATILLVDDEPVVRMGTAALLADGGYEVVEAASAEEALDLARNGLAPDALVTDFAMPGDSGVTLARKLREERPNLPVLLITGFASLSEADTSDVFRLDKPFRQAELLASLATAIERGRPSP